MSIEGVLDGKKIIKWILGERIEMIFNEKSVIEFIKKHRLVNRVLYRLNEEKPVWFTNTMLENLTEEQKKIDINLNQHKNTLKEISNVLCPRNQPLIVVKGFSTYALTHDCRNIRFSSDIDLFYGDMDYLKNSLYNLGFSMNGPMARHEFANMVRDDTDIDIHRCFPVFSYPNDHNLIELDP